MMENTSEEPSEVVTRDIAQNLGITAATLSDLFGNVLINHTPVKFYTPTILNEASLNNGGLE